MRLIIIVASLVLWNGVGQGVEVFAKGSVSRNSLSKEKWTIGVTASAGLAFHLTKQVRIEGRYTNVSSLQNKLDVVSSTLLGTLTDILSETEIYSVGIDIDILGPRNKFKPFLYVGVGYVVTERSYDFTETASSTAIPFQDPTQEGISGNVGLGVRWQIAKRFAIELEVFAYSVDFHKPGALIDIYGTAGIRIRV